MSYANEVACVNSSFLQLNNNGNMISEWYNAKYSLRTMILPSLANCMIPASVDQYVKLYFWLYMYLQNSCSKFHCE